MRIATIIVRILVGLILLFASVTYFLMMMQVIPFPKQEMSEGVMKWNAGADATGYLMPLVKVLELICGVLFVSGFYVALANIVILPISINVFLFHAFLGPETIGMGAALLLGNIFLIYAYRDRYTAVLAR